MLGTYSLTRAVVRLLAGRAVTTGGGGAEGDDFNSDPISETKSDRKMR